MTPDPLISIPSYDQFPHRLYFTKRPSQSYGWYRIHESMHALLSRVALEHGFENLKTQLNKMTFPSHKERVNTFYETKKITYRGRCVAHNEEELLEIAQDIDTFLRDKKLKYNRTKAAAEPASVAFAQVPSYPPLLDFSPGKPTPATDMPLSKIDYPHSPTMDNQTYTSFSDLDTVTFSDSDAISPFPLDRDVDLKDLLGAYDSEPRHAYNAVSYSPTLEQGAGILLDFMDSADAKEPATVTLKPREITGIKDIQYLRNNGHYRFIAPHVEVQDSDRSPVERLKRADEYCAEAKIASNPHARTALYKTAAAEYLDLAKRYQERKKIHSFFAKEEEKSSAQAHTQKHTLSQVSEGEKRARFK